MTYNFDPDQWLDTQTALLRKRLAAGEISEQEFQTAMEELDERYQQMWKRLDGYFRIEDD